MELTSSGKAADLTNFNGEESVLPKGVTDSNSNWITFISTWMMKAHMANVNTLGYVLTALDSSHTPTTIAPTFMPTFNQFQTCEWRSQSDSKAVQGIPSGDNNCLLYLQMTKGSDAPDSLHYAYTGNMVDDQETGTLFISRKLFWDKWLLPQLTVLNYKTLLVATGASCDNNEVNPNWHYDWKMGKEAADAAGRSGDQDPFYAWKSKSQGLSGPYGFVFEPSPSHWDDHRGIWGSELKCDIDCMSLLPMFSRHCMLMHFAGATRNEISFTPGGDTITISGHIYCRLDRWTTAGGSGS